MQRISGTCARSTQRLQASFECSVFVLPPSLQWRSHTKSRKLNIYCAMLKSWSGNWNAFCTNIASNQLSVATFGSEWKYLVHAITVNNGFVA